MNAAVRKSLTAIVCLLAPPPFKRGLLNVLGHRVSSGARIGFSIVRVERLCMEAGARIGHLNWIDLRRLAMRRSANIGSMNTIRRGMSIRLADYAAIGNRNAFVRGWTPSPVEPSLLRLGVWAKVTSEHYVEMTRSIRLGDYSTIAGVRTQFWTHGFVHAETGLDRWLVVGKIIVGDNVYIGSGSVVTCGVRIANAVSLGVASSVVKSLDKPGLYAAQPLRYFDRTSSQRLAGLEQVAGATPADAHYRRDP